MGPRPANQGLSLSVSVSLWRSCPIFTILLASRKGCDKAALWTIHHVCFLLYSEFEDSLLPHIDLPSHGWYRFWLENFCCACPGQQILRSFDFKKWREYDTDSIWAELCYLTGTIFSVAMIVAYKNYIKHHWHCMNNASFDLASHYSNGNVWFSPDISEVIRNATASLSVLSYGFLFWNCFSRISFRVEYCFGPT